jgi:Flp pilus assembly protein TadG
MKIPNRTCGQTKMVARGLKCAAAPDSARVDSRSIGSRVRGFLRSGGEGAAIVEMALVAPIFMILLTGMFSLSMALYNYQKLGFATFTGAQQLAVSRGEYTDPCYQAAQFINAALPGWTPSQLTITMYISSASGSSYTTTPYTFSGNVASGSGCTAAGTGGAAQMAKNEPATVQLSYAYNWLPIWGLKLSGNLVTASTVLVD